MHHYSTPFVARGGHRAVAEALNEGQCDALRDVVRELAPDAGAMRFLPLYVFCVLAPSGWRLSSLASSAALRADLRALVRRRALRESLLGHAPDDLDRARAALADDDRSPLVLRLVTVFGDESSHVNAVVVGRGEAELFEPKGGAADTPQRPFGAVRRAVRELLAAHGRTLAPSPPRRRLQAGDDLCQTWVAAYVVERARGATPEAAARRLESGPGCDRLCALLRFSEAVYRRVAFAEETRRGRRHATLAARGATTSRPFGASPGPCRREAPSIARRDP